MITIPSIFSGAAAVAAVVYALIALFGSPPHVQRKVAGAIIIFFFFSFLAVVLTKREPHAKRLSQTSHTITTTPTTPSHKPKPPKPLGPQLTAAQLGAVLVPAASYNQLLPQYYSAVTDDGSNTAVLGGLASMQLCSTALPDSGLGAERSASYWTVGFGARPDLYFGSDAASFTGQGAEQLLSAAAEQGPTCGWRSLPGSKLDDQVVRLTADLKGPGGAHNDLILVRDGACVVAVGTVTTGGSHSSDAETLADGAAQRLALAVHSAGPG